MKTEYVKDKNVLWSLTAHDALMKYPDGYDYRRLLRSTRIVTSVDEEYVLQTGESWIEMAETPPSTKSVKPQQISLVSSPAPTTTNPAPPTTTPTPKVRTSKQPRGSKPTEQSTIIVKVIEKKRSADLVTKAEAKVLGGTKTSAINTMEDIGQVTGRIRAGENMIAEVIDELEEGRYNVKDTVAHLPSIRNVLRYGRENFETVTEETLSYLADVISDNSEAQGRWLRKSSEAVKFDKEETGYGSWKVRRPVNETGKAPSPPAIPEDDGEELINLDIT